MCSDVAAGFLFCLHGGNIVSVSLVSHQHREQGICLDGVVDGDPLEGSGLLYLLGIALHLFAVTSLGIFLACMAQNMPQLGMLLLLVLLPMQMLSGSATPRESMPEWVQDVMLLSPNTHVVEFSQSILFRGAGIEVVWKEYLALLVIGSVLFWVSLVRFRKSVA